MAPGTRLGGYTVLSLLGRGGMGDVYRARDERLGREVAVKVMGERVAADASSLALFEREARALAALSHPNILSIYDFGKSGGRTYAVMELLDGGNLRQRMGGGPLPWRTAVAVALAVTKGLAAAHAKGIVHRDIKPENIFVQADGQVKVLDFGLVHVDEGARFGEPEARAPGRSGFVGSKLYMSPEQVCRRDVDARTDIFALGLVLYEVLTGIHPFSRLSTTETMSAILGDEPAPLTSHLKSIPAQLAEVIHTCLQKDPDRRIPTALDLMLALGEVSLTPEMVRPSPDVWMERALWLGVGLFTGLAMAGIAWLLLT